MKNSTRPARALPALSSGCSSVADFVSPEAAFIGRQNSNAVGRCHGAKFPCILIVRARRRNLLPRTASMVFVLGTDEAGYGPSLGPLCIAASAWQLPDDAPSDGLYDRLAQIVCNQAKDRGDKLAIADSKCLYKSGDTLELLERGVLVALACLDRLPQRWRDIWRALDVQSLLQIDGAPWH